MRPEPRNCGSLSQTTRCRCAGPVIAGQPILGSSKVDFKHHVLWKCLQVDFKGICKSLSLEGICRRQAGSLVTPRVGLQGAGHL